MPEAWERALEDVGATWAFPATPDLREGVLRAIATSPPSAKRPWVRPALALAGAGAAAALVVVAVREDSRDAVADFLGLAVEGERIELVPMPGGVPTPAVSETPADIFDIAEPIALEEARPILGKLPAELPGRDERAIYTFEDLGYAVVVVDYGGLSLWQIQTAAGTTGKGLLGEGTVVEEVLVAEGVPGYWLEGGQRLITFTDADGREVAAVQRTTDAPALVWARDGITYRLEGATLTLDEALAIAMALE